MISLSPCIKLCILDESTGFCRGCGRRIEEIVAWGSLDAAQRKAVAALLPERLRVLEDREPPPVERARR